MKKIFKKLAKKNASELRYELGRAHLIVALLSVGVCALLTLGATTQVEFEPTLSAICIALLSLVTVVSVSSSITLLRKKA